MLFLLLIPQSPFLIQPFQGDGIANLDLVVADDHPIDQQLNDPPTAGEIEPVQARTETGTQDLDSDAEFRETEVLLVLRAGLAPDAPAPGSALATRRDVS
jgi:hypothetical protein